MLKSKNAAIDIEGLGGTLIIMVVGAIVILLFFLYISFEQSQKGKDAEISFENLNVDYNLNYFLRLETDEGKSIIDLIRESNTNKDYTKLKSLSDQFFNDIYDPLGLSYDLVINGKSISSVIFGEYVVSSSAKIPTANKQVLDIDLIVGKPTPIITP